MVWYDGAVGKGSGVNSTYVHTVYIIKYWCYETLQLIFRVVSGEGRNSIGKKIVCPFCKVCVWLFQYPIVAFML